MSDKTESDAMLTAVADFLKSKGWSVVVIGDAKIRKLPDEREYIYEFALKFTGAPPKTETNNVGQQQSTVT